MSSSFLPSVRSTVRPLHTFHFFPRGVFLRLFFFYVAAFPQTFNELSAREVIDPGDLSPLQTQLEELESALMDLEMYEVSWVCFSGLITYC